jgi:acyl-coenzyme A synthetase/AMP-(fatty) acid ligase
MNTILSRDLISKDFLLIQENFSTNEKITFDKDQLCHMIDYWKVLLVEKYNAQPGQKVLLEFNLTNAYYWSAIFAVWELGLIMIVDWPHAFNHEDATSYRMTMHGKIDFAIVYSRQTDPNDKEFYSYWDYERNRLNCTHIITETEFDNYQIQNHTAVNQICSTIHAKPSDYAVWTASGGTTGLPKQIKITHKEIFLQAQRLCKHLNFQIGENTLHTNNLHHGASMCYHFLPSFMLSKNHYVFNGNPKLPTYRQQLCDYIVSRNINKILLYSSDKLINFLTHVEPLKHHLDIITLFYVNKQCIELLKEKNIRSIRNVFGDTTIGYGFLVKVVDQNTNPETYVVNKIGPKLDDFFDFKIENKHLYVKAVGLAETEWKTSQDQFELIDGHYHFYGRGNNFRIGDEWINLGALDKKVAELFFDDGATVVIDNEEQKMYLSVWKQNPVAELELKNYLTQTYQAVTVNKIARDLDPIQYTVSRKIDRQKLLQYFRKMPS